MAEKLTQIELSSVQTLEPQTKLMHRGDFTFNATQIDDVETGCGLLHVIIQGDRGKPAIFTYHDIGLNSTTCFEGFFSYPDMQPILQKFCVYHINAPGQQEGYLPLPQGAGLRHSESENLLTNISTVESEYTATKRARPRFLLVSLSDETNDHYATQRTRRASNIEFSIGTSGDAAAVTGYVYPTMDQLADMIMPVMQFYKVKQFIGFGVGAGANVLARFAIKYPEKVEALCLLNCSASKSGWIEWGYQKVNSWYLRSGQITTGVEEYLLWHWFGKVTMDRNHDLVHLYSQHIKAINPTNLAHFIESYIKRSDLGLIRETDPVKKLTTKTIKCPMMLVAGDYSPHLDDTVNMNARLDPATCQWMKFECGGMIHEEAPQKLCEALRLFLQGIGYVTTLSSTRLQGKGSSVSTSSHLQLKKSSMGPRLTQSQQAVC